jgi:hypothetical protein
MALVAGIARKQSQYRDQFDSVEHYENFHKWLTRAAKYPFSQTADALQGQIVVYLEDRSEARAARWFTEYMTGELEGRWMLAHSTIGAAPNNMGNESYFRWLKAATNAKKNVSLNHFLGAFMAHAADASEEEYAKIRGWLPNNFPEKVDTSKMSPWSYAKLPVIPMKVVESVEKMDWECIVCMSPETLAAPEAGRLRTMLERASAEYCHALGNDTEHRVLTVGDAMPFVDTSFRATTHFKSVIMPTHQYVQALREKRPQESYREDIAARADRFCQACIEGSLVVDMKEMIRLSEDFVVCDALSGKWSMEVRHKCTCPRFFSKAMCEHVVVLAMLADPTKKVLPERNDIKRIKSRAAKRRGRPAKEGDSDSLEEARKKPKRVAEKEKKLASGLLTDSDGEDSVPEVSSIVYEQVWWNLTLWVQEPEEVPAVHAKDKHSPSSQPVEKRCVHCFITSSHV